MGQAAFLELRDLTKSFGEIRAVDSVSLSIDRGEFFSLLGPSGCGKTTLLRLVAGFEMPDLGSIFLDGQELTPLPPNRRRVNTIFQNYALFPHLSVRENIAFGPRTARRPKRKIADEVDKMLRLTQMEPYADQKPEQLSGGQKQRVAIARALINKPDVLLLDEPLAALDLKLRQRMLLELDQIHDQAGITFLYVTHDQGEAMSLSDRIAVMNAGRIEQVGTPAEIYEAPRSGFVAAFIGDTNFLKARVAQVPEPGQAFVEIDGFPRVRCPLDGRHVAGDTVYLSIRPEKLEIATRQSESDGLYNAVRGTVADVIYLGSHTRFRVRIGPSTITILRQQNRSADDDRPIASNDQVWIRWHWQDGFVIEG